MSGQRVVRKLIAIMAADIVGYSRLMGRDKAGTLSSLKAFWKGIFAPSVAEHRGRVVKLMGEDALVTFKVLLMRSAVLLISSNELLICLYRPTMVLQSN